MTSRSNLKYSSPAIGGVNNYAKSTPVPRIKKEPSLFIQTFRNSWVFAKAPPPPEALTSTSTISSNFVHESNFNSIRKRSVNKFKSTLNLQDLQARDVSIRSGNEELTSPEGEKKEQLQLKAPTTASKKETEADENGSSKLLINFEATKYTESTLHILQVTKPQVETPLKKETWIDTISAVSSPPLIVPIISQMPCHIGQTEERGVSMARHSNGSEFGYFSTSPISETTTVSTSNNNSRPISEAKSLPVSIPYDQSIINFSPKHEMLLETDEKNCKIVLDKTCVVQQHIESVRDQLEDTSPSALECTLNVLTERPPLHSNLINTTSSIKHESVTTMSSKMEKRLNIAREILSTERTYVEGLLLIEKIFYKPLIQSCNSSAPIITKKSINSIFSNLIDILNINQELLRQLDQRLEQTSKPWNPSKHLIGDIFVDMAPYFKMYSLYVKNFHYALSVISNQINISPNFAKFLKDDSIVKQCKGLSFEAYLILPVQRIPRYKLLIEDLLKYTDITHRDYANLEKALDMVERVAIFVNETIRQHEMFMEMLNIQKSLSGFNEVLLIPGRKFIKRGSLYKICRKNHQIRYFYLFSDMLIYASTSIREDTLNFHRKIDLEVSKLVDVQDTRNIKNSFQIINPEKSFAVYVETAELKKEWMSAIQTTIDELISAKRTLKIEKKHEMIRSLFIPEVIHEYRAPVWIPDENAINCFICDEEFTLFRRKHHCRLCGQVVCHSCSTGRFYIAGSSTTDMRTARSCDKCYKKSFNRLPQQHQHQTTNDVNSHTISTPTSPTKPNSSWFNYLNSVSSSSSSVVNLRNIIKREESLYSSDLSINSISNFISNNDNTDSSSKFIFKKNTNLQRSQSTNAHNSQLRKAQLLRTMRKHSPSISFSINTSIPNTIAKACELCLTEFKVFRWRNQCNNCGKVICGDCVSKKRNGNHQDQSQSQTNKLCENNNNIDNNENLKICDPCYLGVHPSDVMVNELGGGWCVKEKDNSGSKNYSGINNEEEFIDKLNSLFSPSTPSP